MNKEELFSWPRVKSKYKACGAIFCLRPPCIICRTGEKTSTLDWLACGDVLGNERPATHVDRFLRSLIMSTTHLPCLRDASLSRLCAAVSNSDDVTIDDPIYLGCFADSTSSPVLEGGFESSSMTLKVRLWATRGPAVSLRLQLLLLGWSPRGMT